MAALGFAMLAMALGWGMILLLAGPVLAGVTLLVPAALSLSASWIASHAGLDRRGRAAAWIASTVALSAMALFVAGSALSLFVAYREAIRARGDGCLFLVLAAFAQIGWVMLGLGSRLLRRLLRSPRPPRSSVELDPDSSLARSLRRAAGLGQQVTLHLHPDARCDLAIARLDLGLALLHHVDEPALRALVAYAAARTRVSKPFRAIHALVARLRALGHALTFDRELTYMFGPLFPALALALRPLRRVELAARRSARQFARREVRRERMPLEHALVLALEGARAVHRSTCRARRFPTLPGADNVYRMSSRSSDVCACDELALLGEMGPPEAATPGSDAVYRAPWPGVPVASALAPSLLHYEKAFTAYLLRYEPVDVALQKELARSGRRESPCSG